VAGGELARVPQGAYYALSPLAVGLLAAVVVQVALAEIALGRIRRGRWELRGWPAVALAIVFGSAAAVAIATRRTGPTAVDWS
jgi:hypothetical protein